MQGPLAECFAETPAVSEIDAEATSLSPRDLESRTTPLLLRGFVRQWPCVAAARSSVDGVHRYLARFDRGAAAPVTVGPSSAGGRVFYNDAFDGMNVERGNARIGELLHQVRAHGGEPAPPLIYLASADVDECFPGFRAENDLPLDGRNPLVSIWIGTRTRIAAHNDLPLNIACVCAGARRFTLFPPDQTPNLYVGPFEQTPAGRPISLVDFAAPDLERFPRFRDAVANAEVALLEAGDALFIPSMWWHHVEAFGTFNVLVNYWWRTTPDYLGTPQDALNHAMLAIRDLPEVEKQIWRDLFDHYVFGDIATANAHVPANLRGILDPITPDSARSIRAFLASRLKR